MVYFNVVLCRHTRSRGALGCAEIKSINTVSDELWDVKLLPNESVDTFRPGDGLVIQHQFLGVKLTPEGNISDILLTRSDVIAFSDGDLTPCITYMLGLKLHFHPKFHT